ncbi:MAG: hypothetical protein AAF902_02415 [Chloroflexota bacterium]
MIHKQTKKPVCIIDEDDKTIGRIFTRREAIKMLSATGGAIFLSACFAGQEMVQNAPAAGSNINPDCVVRPALDEGPVFVEQELARSDIRTDTSNGVVSAGALLDLSFRVTSIANNACTPLENVQVDIWQCDATGVYSDTSELGFQTVGQKFLRGYQTTDADGMVKFITIYPGWYEGRAVHIHVKFRTPDGYDFTSQVFFDDAFTDQVFTEAPYNSRGERILRNADDGIYNESNGQMMLNVSKTEQGYTAATFTIALDLS